MNNLNSFYLLTGLFMVVSTVMILVILMQRPKGGGLSAAFGGSSAGSADSLLGGRVGDTLTWVCLLYTSPSPRDKTVSRMPSSA